MENSNSNQNQIFPDDLPPLLKKIKTKPVSGFDMMMGSAKEKDGSIGNNLNIPLDFVSHLISSHLISSHYLHHMIPYCIRSLYGYHVNYYYYKLITLLNTYVTI